YGEGYHGWDDNLTIGEDDKFWGGSIGLIFNVAEATRFEAGYGYEQDDDTNEGVNTVNVGVYWDPVSQVTVGLQGDWQNFKDQPGTQDDNFDEWNVRFGTWLRFK